MRKVFLRIGSLLAMLAVILGAFGAHALKEIISAEQLAIFDTGVRYHFYHALAILLVDVLIHFRKTNVLTTAGWIFLAGIVCFSGSLYVLAFREVLPFSVSWLGPVTPLGGLFFIFGWLTLFLSTFVKSPKISIKGMHAADQE